MQKDAFILIKKVHFIMIYSVVILYHICINWEQSSGLIVTRYTSNQEIASSIPRSFSLSKEILNRGVSLLCPV